MAFFDDVIDTYTDIGSAIPIFGSAFAGIGQKRDLDRLSKRQKEQADAIKLNRPVLGRTQGGLEGEGLSRAAASTSNDEIYKLGQEQIAKGQASTNRAISNTGASGSDIMGGIISADRNARDANLDNLQGAAERQMTNRQSFYDQLSRKSIEERGIFDYNQNQPYQNDYLRKYNLLDSSSRNDMMGKQALRQGLVDTGNNITGVATSIAGMAMGNPLAGLGLGSATKGMGRSAVSGYGEVPNLA